MTKIFAIVLMSYAFAGLNAHAERVIVCASKENRTNKISENQAAAMGGIKNAYRVLVVSELTKAQREYSYRNSPASYHHLSFSGTIDDLYKDAEENRVGDKLVYHYDTARVGQMSTDSDLQETLVIDLQKMTAARSNDQTGNGLSYNHCTIMSEYSTVAIQEWVESTLRVSIKDYSFYSSGK